jgi:hypothetical protein
MKIPRKIIKPFLILTLISPLLIFSGCADFKPKINTEDKAVRLDGLGDAPIGENRDYEIGDDVAVIYHDGRFYIDGVIKETGGEIIFVENLDGAKKEMWKPAESVSKNRDDARRAEKGFRVRIGTGRFAIDEWFPAEQIFPAPWANNKNLEIGDTVYRKRFGDFKPEKGVIEDLPQSKFSGFKVKFENQRTTETVDTEEIFSSIEQAKAKDLSPGKIIYYDKSYWAMVIGKRGDQIIIRQTGVSPQDISVDISKLEILK